MIEGFYIAAKQNKEYSLTKVILEHLEALIVDYEGEGSSRELQKALSEHKSKLTEKIQQLLFEMKHTVKQRKGSYESLIQDLKLLKETSEPIPERSLDRAASRKILEQNGINCRAFYECIDFKPTIPDAFKVVLEAELTDLGLLDALVIAPEHKSQAQKLLQSASDSYLTGDAPVQESRFFTITEKGALVPEIKRILSLFETQVQLGADGCYRHGILAGHSLGKEHVLFIGAENRRQHRQRQIEALEASCREAETQYQIAKADLEDLQRRMDMLEQEYSQLPSVSDLNAALNLLQKAENNLHLAEQQYNEQEQICQEEHQKLLACTVEAKRACSAFPQYEMTSAFFHEIMDDLVEYRECLQKAADCLRRQQELQSRQDSLTEQIEELEADADRMDAEIKADMQHIKTCEEIIRQCDAFLNRPENQDISRRKQEIDRELSECDEQRTNYRDKVTEQKTIAKQLRDSVLMISERLQKLKQEENDLSDYFEEEYALHLILPDPGGTTEDHALQALTCVLDGEKQRNIQEISSRLDNAFTRYGSTLTEYRPMRELLFPDAGSDVIRSRIATTLTWHGHLLPPVEFEKRLTEAMENDRALLDEEETKLFREILMNTLSKKLYVRISESRKWVQAMSALMKEIHTSMGLTFSLRWEPRQDLSEHELPFEELNRLLAGNSALMRPEDFKRLSNHFRSRIEQTRLEMEEQGTDINYSELVKQVLDFRNWFTFQLRYQESGDPRYKELTASRFNTFSGGERALALYIPLFAAVAAQYEKAECHAPKILALDEAFAGVDDSNISEMFGLLEKLQFGYIVNSQALWGCYDTVPALAIAELCHEKDSDFITVLSYEWNGKQKTVR